MKLLTFTNPIGIWFSLSNAIETPFSPKAPCPDWARALRLAVTHITQHWAWGGVFVTHLWTGDDRLCWSSSSQQLGTMCQLRWSHPKRNRPPFNWANQVVEFDTAKSNILLTMSAQTKIKPNEAGFSHCYLKHCFVLTFFPLRPTLRSDLEIKHGGRYSFLEELANFGGNEERLKNKLL